MAMGESPQDLNVPSSPKEITKQLMVCLKQQTKTLQTLTKTENELTKCRAEKIGFTDKLGIAAIGVVIAATNYNLVAVGIGTWLIVFQ